jgi:O-antigen/teichoic acid export membrane protein
MVLGADFAPSIPVFSWMLLAALILLIVNPYDYVLYATKKHSRLVVINIISLVLVVALSVYLMKHLSLGAVGAALINLIVWATSGLYAIFLVKKHLKFSFYWRSIQFILPAAILTAIAWGSFSYLSPSFVLKLVVSLITMPIYWLYLYRVKLIRSEDIKYFINLLKLK